MQSKTPRAESGADPLPPFAARVITLTALQWGLTRNEILLRYLYGPVPRFVQSARNTSTIARRCADPKSGEAPPAT
jgi:hypothetical protein